jgi:Kef-type K+ transport system membrane component KefB
MTERHDLVILLVLVTVSVMGPLVAGRLRLPAAVLLIVAGVLLGPGGIGIVHDSVTVAFLSELGFLVLMFIAGMEIDFDAIRLAGPRALSVPGGAMLLVFAAAVLAGRLLRLPGIEVLVISATSVGMPLAILQEFGATRSAFGKHVMLTASVGEFFSIVAIVAFEIYGREGGFGLSLVLHLLKVVMLFVTAATAIRWARAVVWWHPDPFRRIVEQRDVAELGVRTGLFVMLAFVVLVSIVGVEPILGAFIGGALVAFVLREKRVLEEKIAALGNGLFIPIFFFVIGVRFDPALLDRPTLVRALVLVLLAGAVKLLPSLVVAPRGFRLRERVASGFLLAAPLTLVVAIAEVGRKLGLLAPAEHASLVLVALVLSVVYPVLCRIVRGADVTEDAPAAAQRPSA